jgi:hypothetical protein
MKNNRSFINIQKLLDNNSLDAICWIMITYDRRVSDMSRLIANIKVKVRHNGILKNAFFQDVILNLDGDLDFLRLIFKKTKDNYPESEDDVDFVLSKISEWKAYNKGIVNKETSPIMFSSRVK